jgi:hypothetical protein
VYSIGLGISCYLGNDSRHSMSGNYASTTEKVRSGVDAKLTAESD